jgi:hypothetical protein
MLRRQVQFLDLSGHSISAALPANSTAESACALLADQLMVSKDDVRIVDTGVSRDSPYYPTTSSLPPSPIYFQIVTKKGDPKAGELSLSRFTRAQQMGQMSSSVEYASYGSTPPDDADRVAQLTRMGFGPDLVEDTLRVVNFDVEYAVDLLSNEGLRRQLEHAYVRGEAIPPRAQAEAVNFLRTR